MKETEEKWTLPVKMLELCTKVASLVYRSLIKTEFSPVFSPLGRNAPGAGRQNDHMMAKVDVAIRKKKGRGCSRAATVGEMTETPTAMVLLMEETEPRFCGGTRSSMISNRAVNQVPQLRTDKMFAT